LWGTIHPVTYEQRRENGMAKARIIWNGQGGELDSVTVNDDDRDDESLTKALIKFVDGNVVRPGDSFVVEEVA
jgi:hypothetical protein